MQASGLVEFASHSYALHRGVQANPQGNMTPSAFTWRYDPATRRYETDAQQRARIRADLQRSRQQIAANLGRPPRAIVWPYGRYTEMQLAEAKALGFTFAAHARARALLYVRPVRHQPLLSLAKRHPERHRRQPALRSTLSGHAPRRLPDARRARRRRPRTG